MKCIIFAVLVLAANGQIQWSYISPVVQQPYFYQAPTQFYNPTPQFQQIYQSPIVYHHQNNIQYTQPQSNAKQYSQSADINKSVVNFSPQTFRGFGYTTSYEDGASSTVVFFNGPRSNPISFKNTVTVASDILDPQTDTNIQNTLKKSPEGRTGKSNELPTDPLAAIRSFLENPKLLSNGINYFSTPGHPADTIPLSFARSLEINNNTNSTDTSKENTLNVEQEPAESILQSKINEIPNDIKPINSATTDTELTSTSSTSEAATDLNATSTNENSVTTISPLGESTEESAATTVSDQSTETTTILQ